MNSILVLDKNHPPQAVTSLMESIEEYRRRMHLDIKMIAITPLVSSLYQDINGGSYPFSLTYLLNCIDRCINREYHETLVGNPNKLTSVVFMFFKLYRNIKFSAAQLHKSGFYRQISVPFH